MKKIKVLLIGLLAVVTVLSPGLALARDKEFGEGKIHGLGGAEIPQVVEVSPIDGAVNVSLDSQISFVFDQPMNRTSVNAAFGLEPYVFGNLSTTCTKNYFFYAKLDLRCGTSYQLTIAGSARSRQGVELGEDYSWSFTTVDCYGGTSQADQDDDRDEGDAGDQSNDGGNKNDSQGSNSDYDLVVRFLQSEEIYVGDEVGFSLTVANTGDNQINVLPVEYNFDSNYLQFLSSTPTADVPAGSLQVESGAGNAAYLKWNDLTESFGDLEIGGSVSFDLIFLALADTHSTTGIVRAVGVQDDQGQILDEKSSSVNITILNSGGSGSSSPDVTSGVSNEAEDGGDPGRSQGIAVVSFSSGGAGGYIPAPSARIDYSYPPEKFVGRQYVENIRLTNTGGAVLTHGELILDLPEDRIEFIAANPTQADVDENNQIIKWQIPALGMDREFAVNVVVRPIAAGEAFTQVSYLTDQLDRRIDRREVILAVDHEITENTQTHKHTNTQDVEIQETQKIQNHKVVQDVVVEEDEGLPAAIEIDVSESSESPEGDSGGEDSGGEDSGGEEEEEFAQEKPILISNDEKEEKLSGKIEVSGEVAGMVSMRANCAWWAWVLVIILHLVALIIYYYYTVLEEEEEVGEGAEKKIRVIKGSWSWWWRVLICLAIIFILFNFVCHLNTWLLVLILVLYFAGLAMIYALIRKAEKRDWIVLPILALASVVVPAIACEGRGVAGWIISVVLLVLILVNYYYLVALIKTRRLWALLPFWLTILVVVMEVLVRWCGC